MLFASAFINTGDTTSIKKIESGTHGEHPEFGGSAKSKIKQGDYTPRVLFDEAHNPMISLNPNVNVDPYTFNENTANLSAVKNKILNSCNKQGQNGGYDAVGGYGFNWSGKYSSLRDVLIKNGFNISTLDGVTVIDNNTFETAEGGVVWGDPLYSCIGPRIIESNLIVNSGGTSLPAYDLFVIPGSRGNYTDEELSIIQKYVRVAGGSILVLTEFYQLPGGYYSPGAEQILEMFGMKVRGVVYDDAAVHQANSSMNGGAIFLEFKNNTTNQNHPITRNVGTLEYYKGGYFGRDAYDTYDPTSYPADAVPLVRPYSTAKDARNILSPASDYATLPSDAAIALALSSGKTTGKGRMVAVGDTDMFATWNQLTNHNNGDIDHDGRPDFNDTDNNNDIFALNIFNWLTRYDEFDMYFAGESKYVMEEVEPGQTAAYGISMERLGHYSSPSNTVDINATSFPDICTMGMAWWEESSDRISYVELFDTAKRFYLIVNMPTNITESQQITIFLNGTSRNDQTVKHSIQLELSVVVRYGVKFESENYQLYNATAGTLVNFDINVLNLGNIMDTYAFISTLESTLSEDWNASGWSVNNNITVPQSLSINKGETKSITLGLTIPNNVAGDSSVSISLKATSSISNSTYDITKVSVAVKKIRAIAVSSVIYDFDITPDLSTTQSRMGKFTLKNNGNIDENVTCVVSSSTLMSPTDYWSIGLLDGGSLTSALSVYLPRGSDAKTYSVNATIPADMLTGAYVFYVKIVADNVTITGDVVNVTSGGQNVSAVKMSVTIQKAMAISLERTGNGAFTSDPKNSTIVADVVLINKGNAVDNITVTLGAVTRYEDGVEISGFTFVGSGIVKLNPGEQKRYRVALKMPTDLNRVLYKITITTTSSVPTISNTTELSFDNQIAITYDVVVTNIDFSFKDVRGGDIVDVIVSVTDLSDVSIHNATVLLDIDGITLGSMNVSLKDKVGTAKFHWTASSGNHTITAIATIEKDTIQISREKRIYKEVLPPINEVPPPPPTPGFDTPIILSIIVGSVLILFYHRRLKDTIE